MTALATRCACVCHSSGVDHIIDGEPVDYSYINHYLANGLTLLCGFDDPQDEHTAEVFTKLLPDRAVELVDARPIFARGGGIHCITQQQPKR